KSPGKPCHHPDGLPKAMCVTEALEDLLSQLERGDCLRPLPPVLGDHPQLGEVDGPAAVVVEPLEDRQALAVPPLRLVCSTVVMAYLKQARVRFVACDNPFANELTIDILVAVAADEGRRISLRNK